MSCSKAANHGGPQERTVSKHLEAIGKRNDKKDERSVAEKIQGWCKDPENGARCKYIWSMIEHNQIDALMGQAVTKRGREAAKKVLRRTNMWGKIPPKDQKQAILDAGVVSGSTLKRLLAKDKFITEKLFIYCSARRKEMPLPTDIKHGTLWELIGFRIQAAGNRQQYLQIEDSEIDFDQCGPWMIAKHDGKRWLRHRFLHKAKEPAEVA